MKNTMKVWVMMVSLAGSGMALAQTDSTFTLEKCVSYAMENKPEVNQALIDEEIGEREIKASLSAWLPQISANYALVHNLKLQTTAFGDQLITIGRNYNSNVMLQATQSLYNNDAILASRAAGFSRTQLDQNTELSKINTVVDVSKAFYDILLTGEQLNILEETIIRQNKQLQDAKSQYQSGIVDKTDYQRASIALANSKSAKKRTEEALKGKYAYLRQLMGYPEDKDLAIDYDKEDMLQTEISIDTLQELTYQSRVEFRQLNTNKELLKLNTSYQQLSYVPTVSAYFNYNPMFMSNDFQDLYATSYPTSAVGLQVSLPIFQGSKRWQNVKLAKLQEDRMDVTIENSKRAINTEYEMALASYKSDYFDMETLKENAVLAEEVYETIKLQYDEGIRAYVDLIVAETDLQTAQLNYLNALFQVLSSKLDYERALGNINIL